MKYDEFLKDVQELGQYADRDTADQVSRAVLATLTPRMTPENAEHLAAQLPEPLSDAVRESEIEEPESFGVEEYLRRVAAATESRPTTAELDASSVLTAVAHRISGGELNNVLSQLPSGYATLFGKPELSN
ncbi:DUF2267 domain-containing protein [Nocardiopsis algeriensis]|uniref:Uncharacterized protein (DUF2267 family) n=1 Tax=Nocardiopsis algeriensis TaxID=1478215 RepID=A0A841IYL6_9ACTN|nr:DUF2267 domain-containing protein [Nocardiopsis algeriensis]MBB6121328.1 uncharacterized protein (DUF2267 family) [Nocardiopsis algeriensis]